MVPVTSTPLQSDATLVDAVREIEKSAYRMAIVVDSEGRLIGTLTDGDIRRWLLKGGSLESLALDAATLSPQVAAPDDTHAEILGRMKAANIRTVPKVARDNTFLGLLHVDQLKEQDTLQAVQPGGITTAVIMAGGLGTRLWPLTENLPKPMVDVGGVPMLERIVANLAEAGVTTIYICVNYLGHLIEEHMKDGARFGVSIRYVSEKERMGTAGALSLIDTEFTDSFIVINGDIVTTARFDHMAGFHDETDADITVAATEYMTQVPYGVLETDDVFLTAVREKPTYRYLCNAGIYILKPQVVRSVPSRFFDMPDLLEMIRSQSGKVAVFPIHEYWSDIGTHEDLETARKRLTPGKAP